jgi:hypothetical protein
MLISVFLSLLIQKLLTQNPIEKVKTNKPEIISPLYLFPPLLFLSPYRNFSRLRLPQIGFKTADWSFLSYILNENLMG